MRLLWCLLRRLGPVVRPLNLGFFVCCEEAADCEFSSTSCAAGVVTSFTSAVSVEVDRRAEEADRLDCIPTLLAFPFRGEVGSCFIFLRLFPFVAISASAASESMYSSSRAARSATFLRFSICIRLLGSVTTLGAVQTKLAPLPCRIGSLD